MTDIKEPINTTSDGTFLSVVCENPEKSVVGQKLEGLWPPQSPQELPPCRSEMEGREKVYFTTEETTIYPKSLVIYLKSSYYLEVWLTTLFNRKQIS